MPPAPGPVLIVSPHPDDAVLSTSCVLGAAGEVVVAVLATAVPPEGTLSDFDRWAGASSSADVTRTRLAEDVEALAVFDRAPTPLGLLDDQHRAEPVTRAEVAAVLAPLAEAAGAVVAPVGIGRHPDHVAARDAALDLAAARGLPVALYAELPYCVQTGWPSWVTGLPPRPHLVPEVRWALDLRHGPVTWEHLSPRPVALSAATLRRKAAALDAYPSQREQLEAGPLRRLSHPEIAPWELLFDVAGHPPLADDLVQGDG